MTDLRPRSFATALALGLSLATAAAASGSLSPPGGPQNLYAQGKAIYARKLACENCPFPGGLKDADAAAQARKRVEQGEFGLSDAERAAVSAYLARRFKRG